ncbi:MAG: hypothetical protein SGI87_09135 [Flavobacteriales bacterium]|nr:hypothetical protein [Flavobacteriales bacterium]
MKTLCCILLLSTVAIASKAQISGNVLYYETNTNWTQNYAAPFAQQQKAIFNGSNEILMEVNAMHNAIADSYLAIFHLAQVGNTAREADSLMNFRIQAFKKGIKNTNLKESDFVVDMLSMLPLYEVEVTKKAFSKTYNEVPAGFEIQKNVHIHFYSTQDLDKIITAASLNEIYDLVKVDYFVKSQDAIYDSLRKTASELIKKRIKQYQDLGVAMEGQWTLAVDQTGVYFPLDRYTSYTSNSTVSLEAAKKKGQVTQMKKPQGIFYNKLPYAGFDIVMNPEIVEPAVQYTYNIQVKFVMEKKVDKPEPVKETKTEFKYLMVTPEGQIKELPTK